MERERKYRHRGANVVRDLGAVYYDKLVLNVRDLATAAPGTRINCHGSAEVLIYSDSPVAVQYGSSGRISRYKTFFRLTGRLDYIDVQRLVGVGVAVGRLVVYLGDPALGVSFQRESPEHVVRSGRLINFATDWAIAGTDCDSDMLTIPGNGTWAGSCEAFYLWSLYIDRRTVGGALEGTIDRIHAVSLAPATLFEHWNLPGANPVHYVLPGAPARLADDSLFVVAGSASAVATQVTLRLELSLI